MNSSVHKKTWKHRLLLGIITATFTAVVLVAMSLISQRLECESPWIIPSMGAAVVLFSFRENARIRDFLVLNLVAAAVGISVSLVTPSDVYAVILGLAIVVLMLHLIDICHPPAGATVIIAAVYGKQFQYDLIPYPLIPSLLLFSCAFYCTRKIHLLYMRKWEE